MSYQIELSSSAQRELRHLRGDIYARLESAIGGLAEEPRPPGCRKMAGNANEWRIRVGTYRVIYTIDDAARQVLICRIGHRRDVYRS